MEVGDKHLCLGCMHPLDESGKCRHCGLIQSKYQPIPRCLLPGTVLANRYMLGKVLGEGSFGITYIGWDKVLEVAVAIKEFYPADMVSRDVLRGVDKNVYIYENHEKDDYDGKMKKFLDEARRLTRFNQMEGIVSVRDFFYENNTAYIIMEFIDGISLKEYIKKNGPVSGSRMLEWMKPMLKTMEKVHGTGLIHRDISPDNILINEDNQLVLIDFGAARLGNSEMTRSLTVVFKRGFSPEEQYRARGKQGAWSDVYSLCATMYYMVTGQAPDEAIERMLEDEMPSLVDNQEVKLSDYYKKIIMKGISIHAKDRMQSAGELYQDLYENNKSKILPAHKMPKKFVVVISAVLAVALIGIGTLTVFGNNQGAADRKLTSTNAASDSTMEKPTMTPAPTESITPVLTATIKPLVTPTKTPMVSVSSVIGKTSTKAKSLLEKKGFEVRVVHISGKQKKGTVIRQSKKAGKQIARGSIVKIYVSKGDIPVNTPTPAPTIRPTVKPTAKPTKKPSAKDDFAAVIE